MELPDPLVPGVVMAGTLKVADAESGVKQVKLPEVAGLEWQVQSGGAQQMTIVNGAMSRSESMTIAVRASAIGMYQIPAITVALDDGSTLSTVAQTLHVQAADPHLSAEVDAYAECTFEPATIVVGQATTLVYRLHVRRGEVQSLGVAPPDAAISLGERNLTQGRTVGSDGKEWSVVSVRWPLTFSQPGPVEVRGQQEYFLSVNNGFFDVRKVRKQIAVKPAILTVTALPDDGRPDDFAGLFGPVEVSARLDRARIVSGEGATLELTVRARQAELLSRPTFATPTGMQVYAKEAPEEGNGDAGKKAADKNKKTVAETTSSGTRIFRWDLVPNAPGEYSLPAFSFAYFDADSHTYKRTDTTALTLTVLPGRTQNLNIAGAHAQEPAPTQPITSAVARSIPSTGIAPSLPPPLRGQPPSRPGNLLAIILGVASFVASCAGVGLVRLSQRAPQQEHRGRALAKALASGDLDRAGHIAHQLAATLDGPARDQARTLAVAIDAARFGGRTLDPVALESARQLQGHA